MSEYSYSFNPVAVIMAMNMLRGDFNEACTRSDLFLGLGRISMKELELIWQVVGN